MASSGPPLASGKFRDNPADLETLRDPRLLEELPDQASKKISEELPISDLTSLLQVSKKTNALYNPTVKNCIKKIKDLSLEFLDKLLATASQIRQDFRINRIVSRRSAELEIDGGDAITEVIMQYYNRCEILEKICKRGSPRSFERAEGEKEPLLKQYFSAFEFLPGGIGPWGDFNREHSIDDFEMSCRLQLDFLQNTFLQIITHPEVRKWYANLCCAIFFRKHPNGPLSYESLTDAVNPELHKVVNEFRKMGATYEEMKIVARKSNKQMTDRGWFSMYKTFGLMVGFVNMYMVPLPEDT